MRCTHVVTKVKIRHSRMNYLLNVSNNVLASFSLTHYCALESAKPASRDSRSSEEREVPIEAGAAEQREQAPSEDLTSEVPTPEIPQEFKTRPLHAHPSDHSHLVNHRNSGDPLGYHVHTCRAQADAPGSARQNGGDVSLVYWMSEWGALVGGLAGCYNRSTFNSTR